MVIPDLAKLLILLNSNMTMLQQALAKTASQWINRIIPILRPNTREGRSAIFTLIMIWAMSFMLLARRHHDLLLCPVPRQPTNIARRTK